MGCGGRAVGVRWACGGVRWGPLGRQFSMNSPKLAKIFEFACVSRFWYEIRYKARDLEKIAENHQNFSEIH